MTMKSAMAGQKIGLVSRLRSSLNILKKYREGSFGNAEKDIRMHRLLLQTFYKYTGLTTVENARVLDVGHGQMAQQVALFQADGAKVTGIDIELPTYAMNLKSFVAVLKMNGTERAVKSFVRHLFFDTAYINQLRLLYEEKLQYSMLDCRFMSATDMSFPDNEFDFIHSMAVFEHIDDVPKAVQEINRVLKPAGVASITIHLFPSLSGGHNLEWLYPDKSPSKSVPPWDHLLDNLYPVNAYLNKLRINQYREIFSENMQILNESTVREGERLLIDELYKVLSERGYSREDLLTRTVTFICKKQPGQGIRGKLQ